MPGVDGEKTPHPEQRREQLDKVVKTAFGARKDRSGAPRPARDLAEAGYRPEESNRNLISTLATLNFAPTDSARDNLLRDGVSGQTVSITVNTVVDPLVFTRDHIRGDDDLYGDIKKCFNFMNEEKIDSGHRASKGEFWSWLHRDL